MHVAEHWEGIFPVLSFTWSLKWRVSQKFWNNPSRDWINNFPGKTYFVHVSRKLGWEFLTYEIRKFKTDYSKTAVKIRKQHLIDLEQKLKNLENNLTSEENRDLYNHYKNELEPIYDGIRIRSKREWYEHGEKSTKFFLNLEKKQVVQNQIRCNR